MNELMLNLARKAGARADFGITGVEDENFLIADIYDLELFAQLIVEECCDMVNRHQQHNNPNDCLLVLDIKERFGVAR